MISIISAELDPNERRALRALEDFLNNDPMAILQMHVESKNLRLLDLFRDLDKNNDYRIGVEDVKRKVKVRDRRSGGEDPAIVIRCYR